jgi:hypothetical protein
MGAVFEPRIEAADPKDHPFAALKTFKINPIEPRPSKPKDK